MFPRRDAILEAIGFAANQFLRRSDLHGNIQTLLERLGNAADVSRVYVFENETNDRGYLVTSQRYEWNAPGIDPQIDNPLLQRIHYQTAGLARWEATLGRGDPIYDLVPNLPQSERTILEPQGIRSIAVVPIFIETHWWGFIGFDECQSDHAWSQAEIDAIRAAAGIIGAALQRNQVQRALDSSEMELRKLYRAVEQSPIPTAITDTSGIIEYVNPRFTQLTGYALNEIIGQTFHFLKSGQTSPEEYEVLWSVITTGKEWRGEFQNRKKSGELYWDATTISPITNAHGTITHFLAVKEDITERKRAEVALRESEERFRLVADFTYAWEYWINPDGDYLYISPSCERITGYHPQEFQTRPELMMAIIHPDDRERVAAHFGEELTSKEPMSLAFRIITRDGHMEWIGHVCQSVYGSDGHWLGRRASNREITRRIEVEDALRQSEEHFRMLAENAPDMIFRYRLTPPRGFEYVSPSVTKIVGYMPEEYYADADLDLKMLHPESRPMFDIFKKSPDTYHERIIMRCIHKEGSDVWIEQNHWQLFDETGRPVAIEGICRDITERKHTEAQLLQQQRALSTLRERERLARELHDSIGQVLGYVNTQAQAVRDLLNGNDTATATMHLSNLITVVQEIHADIREFILGTRINGTLAQGFFFALQHHLQSLDQFYGLVVALEVPPEITDTLFAPTVQVQLLRIIQEALTNVRKHAGVSAAHVRFSLSEQHIQVVIEDEGCGFIVPTPDHSSESASLEQHYGLHSMRERTREVGGTVQIDTKPGAGTRVTIQIPRHFYQQHSFYDIRVMLVDDNQLFLQGMQNLLATRGFNVVGTAVNGREAQEKTALLRPNIILMDIDMPTMSGLEVTRLIKAEFPDTQIVMLTISEDDAHLFEAIKSGASGYLLKSLDADELCSLLLDVMQGEAALSPGMAGRVLNEFARQESQMDAATPTPVERVQQLTVHEIEVLTLVSRGHTYKEVGAVLGFSERTIKRYMGEIIQRLQLKNRSEAIELARRLGLSSPPLPGKDTPEQ